MSDDVRFRSLGEKEQRSEWEGRLRELQMEIQEREQRNKEAEQKRLQDEERKRIENQKRAGNPFKCFSQIKLFRLKFKFSLCLRQGKNGQIFKSVKKLAQDRDIHVIWIG